MMIEPNVRLGIWTSLVLLALIFGTFMSCTDRRIANNHDALAPGDIWFRDVTVISPEQQASLLHAHVIVRGNRISSVGIDAPHAVASGATVINGSGKYLVPGLIDGHVHLAQVPGMTPQHESAMPAIVDAYYRQLPRSYLYFGFTVVVDLAVIDRERVESIRSAEIGPAVFHCGNPLVLANGYPMAYFPPETRFKLFSNFLYDPPPSCFDSTGISCGSTYS